MGKIAYMNIGGKRYPLSFSLGASKRISEKYGGLDSLAAAMSGVETLEVKSLDMLVDMAVILISQGCAYKNVFEKNLPREEGDPVDENGNYIPLTKEEVEVGIQLMDVKDFSLAIFESMGRSLKTEVETAEKDSERKNAGATPGL